MPQLGELANTRAAPAITFGNLEERRPAEVPAVLALRRLEVLEHVATRDTRGATAEAFHDEGFHAGSIGCEPRLALPQVRGFSGSE